MNFTNINDPAGVKSLLETLRASQAWQAATTSSPSASIAQASATSIPVAEALETDLCPPFGDPKEDALENTVKNIPPSNPAVSKQIASLLGLLRPKQLSGPMPCESQVDEASSLANSSMAPQQTVASPSSPPKQATPQWQLRHLTFQQSLPHIAMLSGDQAFVHAVSKLRDEQNALEETLWKERETIVVAQRQKVKVAEDRSKVSGVPLSKSDADIMNEKFREELRKFDTQRVIPAWDGLTAKQQQLMEDMGVPTMFNTRLQSDRERQQRIVQVLEGVL